MLEAWLDAGLDIEQFYRLTLGEVAMVLRGRRRFAQGQLEAQRALHYELAGLISFAMHKPSRMPRYTPVGEKVERVPSRPATEADHARIRAYFRRLAGMDAHG